MIRIYKITNLVTNECYIGQTSQSLEARLKKHFASSDCPKLHEAILDYGRKNFIIEELTTCEDKGEANKIESEYILLYNTIEKGYNRMLSDGRLAFENNMRYVCKQEPKNTFSKDSLNEKRIYLNFKNFEDAKFFFMLNKDKILTDSKMYKKKGANMANYSNEQMYYINLVSIINEYMKPKCRPSIYQYDINLSFLKSFDSPSAAARYLNLNKDEKNTASFISEVARGRKRIGYGYIWSYLNPELLNELISIFQENNIK